MVAERRRNRCVAGLQAHGYDRTGGPERGERARMSFTAALVPGAADVDGRTAAPGWSAL